MSNEGNVLKPSAARRKRSTIGWEKKDWGGQFATWPENAFYEGYEKKYHGDDTNDKVKKEWEGIHENSFGNDKRDPMTYHARQEQNKRISKQTRVALEQKAAKAFLVAKALLGKKATADSIEEQAAELMDLPTRSLNSTLKRIFADGEGMPGEAGGEMTEDQLKQKVEELLQVTEQAESKAVEVAEAAGVPVPEKAEEKVEEAPGAGEAPAEAAPAMEAPAEEAPVSEDEIQGILFGEGAEDKASSAADTFYDASSLVDQLFEGLDVKASKEDEVSEIEKKLATSQKQGVKKLVAMTKTDAVQDDVASLWKTLPDVSDIFANRRR
jgi:hypothetical protein